MVRMWVAAETVVTHRPYLSILEIKGL